MKKMMFVLITILMVTGNAFSQDLIPPAPPTGLMIIDYGSGSSLPLRLVWDTNTEADLAFYTVYYGTSSRNYNHFIDVTHPSTSCDFCVTNSPGCEVQITIPGSYYIAVTATDYSLNQSVYSAELVIYVDTSITPTESAILTIGDGSGLPGSSNNVIGVSLNNPSEKIKAVNFEICDVDDYLSCTSCQVTERASNFSCSVREQESGCVNVVLYVIGEDLILEGDGPIFTLNYNVSSSAPPGECRVLNPENEIVANENNFPVDTILEPGEFCFISEGTIIIDGCDTGVLDREIEQGITMSDLIEECASDGDGRHGEFVSCVAKITNEWKKDDLIKGREKGAMQSCAAQADIDGDDILNCEDNCPNISNPNQEDTFPLEGNGIGDACECEGNFDGDKDQDGNDAFTFKIDFGRNTYDNPCMGNRSCNGDFDIDRDVDGSDAVKFKEDFGRNSYDNPCPICIQEIE